MTEVIIIRNQTSHLSPDKMHWEETSLLKDSCQKCTTWIWSWEKKKITSCITSSVGKSIIPMIQGCTLDPQSGDIQESMNSMGEKGDFQQ